MTTEVLKLMFSWVCISYDNPDADITSVVKGKIKNVCSCRTVSFSHQILASTLEVLSSLQFFPLL